MKQPPETKRKRAYIPLPEKLAAALACLLTQENRDDLRDRKVKASEVISLFHFDHIVLHSIGGSDEWHNLDPKPVSIHREKSKRDTSIVAKAKRIDKKWHDFTRSMTERKPKRKFQWPKRKLAKKCY